MNSSPFASSSEGTVFVAVRGSHAAVFFLARSATRDRVIEGDQALQPHGHPDQPEPDDEEALVRALQS